MVGSISPDAYRAARRHAAFLDRSDERGRLTVLGRDRASYLQGLLTNDIAALTAGSGCYAAYLTSQGRMIADLFVYELGDLMMVTLQATTKEAVLARFNQYIFSEDVTLVDVTGTLAQLALIGPEAARVVAGLLDEVESDELSQLREHANRRATFRGRAAIVTRTADAGEPGFDLFVDSSAAGELRSSLAASDAAPLDRATAEVIRIEAGIPRFHQDMDEQTIPLEAGLERRALSFTKGCYVGQEVIIRVLHRGHGRIARKLVGLTFSGHDVPALGSAVRSGARDVGHVTSGARSPAVAHPIALAYVGRDFWEPGTRLAVGDTEAIVTALPFVPVPGDRPDTSKHLG
jgi:folate-binding protein YgfZ